MANSNCIVSRPLLDVLNNLEFLASIRENDKLCLYNCKTKIKGNEMSLARLARYWNGDNLETQVDKIRLMVETGIEWIQKLNKENSIHYDRLTKVFKEAYHGLSTLYGNYNRSEGELRSLKNILYEMEICISNLQIDKNPVRQSAPVDINIPTGRHQSSDSNDSNSNIHEYNHSAGTSYNSSHTADDLSIT